MRALALCIGVALVLGCGTRVSVLAPSGDTVSVRGDDPLGFYERSDAFYQRLLRRRFNALETFNDPVLREHFTSEDLFFDYYADFAQALAEAHFRRSRPVAAKVEEFLYDAPDQVRVQVVFRGQDKRPLRYGTVMLVRVDRWEWQNGAWFVSPRKL